jgi:hypothetical protein
MAKNLQVNLQLNTAQAQSALRQLQQQANQIGRGSGGGGGSGSGGSGGGSGGFRIPGLPGMGGGVAGFAAGAVAAGIATVSREMNELAKRAGELARSANSSSSALGQLRSSIEQAGIGKDIAAGNPGVINFAKLKTEADKALTNFTAGLTGTKEERDKQVADRLKQGLGGPAGEQWRRLKEQGVDLEQDIGIARQAQQVKWQRTERDFAQQRKEYEVQVGNQRFDLQKQASRQQFDQQIAIQKYQENFSNQQSQKAYDLSRQFAAQSFAISQGRATQDFGISQGDKRYDYNLSRSRNQQDYNLSRSRNQQDFNLNKSFSLEDRQDTLTDMALGGASGLDYFRFNRDFQKQQRRAQQQFDIGQGRGEQDFTIGQGRGEQDFNLSNARDTRGFLIGQQRAGQDFSLNQQQAAASRQLELQAQEYARKYEGLELQTQINRQSEDLAINFQRLNQQIGFQETRFSNQAGDMAYDKSLDYSNFNLQTSRQRLGQGYALADFAGQQRLDNPIGAVGQATIDPAFADALRTNAGQTGQGDLIDQFNKTRQAQESSWLLKLGELARQAASNANGKVGDIYNPNNALLGQGPASPRPAFWDTAGGLLGGLGKQVGDIYNPNNSLFGNNSSVGNIGGGNTYNISVTANPELDQKMEAIAAKYAQMAADAIAKELKGVYGF